MNYINNEDILRVLAENAKVLSEYTAAVDKLKDAAIGSLPFTIESDILHTISQQTKLMEEVLADVKHITNEIEYRPGGNGMRLAEQHFTSLALYQ